ncbi:hypothetical protein BD414DRAFT_479356 [Trametes punicea]|nr:hypothetical protein BD414DRAFT_479356 [Trametes punicea]
MTSSAALASRDSILSAYERFRDELDDHNDRRERLIKVRPLVYVLGLPTRVSHLRPLSPPVQPRHHKSFQEAHLSPSSHSDRRCPRI